MTDNRDLHCVSFVVRKPSRRETEPSAPTSLLSTVEILGLDRLWCETARDCSTCSCCVQGNMELDVVDRRNEVMFSKMLHRHNHPLCKLGKSPLQSCLPIVTCVT